MEVFYSINLTALSRNPNKWRNQEVHYVGLGDLIARVLALVGIHPWTGCHCGERRVALNRFYLPVIVYCPIMTSVQVLDEQQHPGQIEDV